VKGYRTFIIIFSSVLILYLIAELNKPKEIDWRVTLSKDDKIPYGGYAVKSILKEIFLQAFIGSYETPAYNQVNNSSDKNTAYIILSPAFSPSRPDKEELDKYVRRGNYVFVAADQFQKVFLDSFKLVTNTRFTLVSKDSTSVNFVNPALKAKTDYTFLRGTIDQYFSKIDTANTVVLGNNSFGEINFIKIPFGKGAYFINANPVCFSNYFLIYNDNASYAAKALSYIPANVSKIFWDEYYKPNKGGAATPLRVFLMNEYLRWALRLALIGMAIYVLFQVKRKQRIIPVIEPLKNTSLDFVKTVASVYFNDKNNNGIAEQKINYFLDFIRQRFNISTQALDETFKQQLIRKSGVDNESIDELINLLVKVPEQHYVSDSLLMKLNNKIDNFYNQV
jgi:hypothetical protein